MRFKSNDSTFYNSIFYKVCPTWSVLLHRWFPGIAWPLGKWVSACQLLKQKGLVANTDASRQKKGWVQKCRITTELSLRSGVEQTGFWPILTPLRYLCSAPKIWLSGDSTHLYSLLQTRPDSGQRQIKKIRRHIFLLTGLGFIILD